MEQNIKRQRAKIKDHKLPAIDFPLGSFLPFAFCLLILDFLILTGPLSAAEEWERVIRPRVWSFPRDFGAHPEFRTEWWYFTGNLADTSGSALWVSAHLFPAGTPAEAPHPGKLLGHPGSLPGPFCGHRCGPEYLPGFGAGVPQGTRAGRDQPGGDGRLASELVRQDERFPYFPGGPGFRNGAQPPAHPAEAPGHPRRERTQPKRSLSRPGILLRFADGPQNPRYPQDRIPGPPWKFKAPAGLTRNSALISSPLIRGGGTGSACTSPMGET